MPKVKMMKRFLTDKQADQLIFYALFAWVVSLVHPALGMMLQFPMIIYLIRRCEIKVVPALMLLMLGRWNLSFFNSMPTALRLGITWTSTSLFAISTFFFVVFQLFNNRYDRKTTMFAWLWLLAIIPAFVISFMAKSHGAVGVWSGPIMDFFAPAVYFWAIQMGASYEQGKVYFIKRIIFILIPVVALFSFSIFYVFSFFLCILPVCLWIYVRRNVQMRKTGFLSIAWVLLFVTLFYLVFARGMHLEKVHASGSTSYLESTDKYGSTFSRMAIFFVGIILAYVTRFRYSGVVARVVPIVMVIINATLVAFVITIQGGNEAVEVRVHYETLSERFQFKLFGDRAAVWAEGWKEVSTPPYVFKDLRHFLVFDPKKGLQMKLAPHNQFLILLGREGFWLGLTLSLFLIWVQMRMFKVMTLCPRDTFIYTVVMPASASIFFIVGITGQSVLSYDLWGNGLATMVLPGVVYGQWVWKRKHAPWM